MIRSLLAAVGLALAVAACSILPAASPVSPGQAARERLVADYLAALAARDAGAISEMVSPGVDAAADIAQAIEAHGGLPLHDARVSWLDDFDGTYVVATVSASGDDGAIHEIRVPMSRINGDYFLAFGAAAPSGSEASPGSPTP